VYPRVCLRYTYVQGTRNSFYNAYSGVARIFALRLLHGMAPVCFEDGMQLRDYVNVRDVARANVLVMEDERANFGVFNAGGRRPEAHQRNHNTTPTSVACEWDARG
jgi:dTDP-L-rhamnose 4-epimerase